MKGELDDVQAELEKPAPEPPSDPKPKVKKGVKKVAKKVEKTAKKAEKKSNGTAKSADDNLVTLASLAEEAEITPASARKKLRGAELENPGRWAWPEGSKGLKEAKKILGLAA